MKYARISASRMLATYESVVSVEVAEVGELGALQLFESDFG